MGNTNNFQNTIVSETSIGGVGLHTGKKVSLVFKPANPNTGIIFKRVDLPGRPEIKAEISNVVSSSAKLRRTSIKKDNVEIHTIEHVMAALSGLRVDNILIEVDSDELPGIDGSVMPFVNLLKETGLQSQNVERNDITISAPLWAKEGDSCIIALPDVNFTVSYTLDYDSSFVPSQYVKYTVDEKFIESVANSRTFCLQEEVDDLRSKGLGKGADYTNTLVIGSKGIVQNELRMQNEFANHKILDLIGDLYLLGKHIKGHIIAIKSGHALNLKLLKKIQKQQEIAERGGIKSPGILEEGEKLDIKAIHKVLPHRYPFLLVDKIIHLEDKKAVGIKNVTINEHFFQGHFPGEPVMPGVLIVEAMAQVAGVLMLSKAENIGKMAYFMSLDNVKFRKTVVPGDQLRLEVEAVKVKTKTGQVNTRALVEGKVVAESSLMFALVNG